VGAIREQTQ